MKAETDSRVASKDPSRELRRGKEKGKKKRLTTT